MTIARVEIFGPVIGVIPYDGEADAIAMANDSDYGLYGSIFTHDDAAVWRVGRPLRTGNVPKHTAIVDRTVPYGGFKQTRFCPEGRVAGLSSLQGTKTVLTA